MQGVVGTELRKARAEMIHFRCPFALISSIIWRGRLSNRGREKERLEDAGRLIFIDYQLFDSRRLRETKHGVAPEGYANPAWLLLMKPKTERGLPSIIGVRSNDKNRYPGHSFHSIFDAILAKPRNPVRFESILRRNQTTEAASKFNMGNTTVELTEQHYFFLREKPLELQKQTQNASIVSIMQA